MIYAVEFSKIIFINIIFKTEYLCVVEIYRKNNSC